MECTYGSSVVVIIRLW